MALSTTGCIRTEVKKDFDLALVLHELNQAACYMDSNTNGQNHVSANNDLNEACMSDEPGSIAIKHYLDAFKELARFFKLTGPVFTFVARDLLYKISMIEKRASSSEHHYSTLSKMIQYESQYDIVYNKGSNASGTRTFLRLHWALEFIIEFMDQLCTTSHDSKTSKVVLGVYERTLALHHPWWTRKLALLAVHTLPSIKTLIGIMCKHNYDEVKLLLGKIVSVGRDILERTNKVLQHHDLTNIP